MSDMWKSRAPPIPLEYDTILDGRFEKERETATGLKVNGTASSSGKEKENAVAGSSKVVNGQANCATSGTTIGTGNKASLRDQRALSLRDNLELFNSRYVLFCVTIL